MFSLSIKAVNKNVLMEIFEVISSFQDQILIRSGDYTVDAHSLIGVFSLDINKPMELLMEKEPTDNFISAMSRFLPAGVTA